MIQLNCIKCGAGLSIDDAFAGGVCRCQHCGAIQKVPSRKRSRPTAPGDIPTATSSAPPPVPTYEQTGAPSPEYEESAPPSPAADAPDAEPADEHLTRADLKHLAEAAAVSSGLRSVKLKKSSRPVPVEGEGESQVLDYATPRPAAKSNTALVIGVIAAAFVVLLMGLGLVLFWSSAPVAVPSGPGGTGNTGAPSGVSGGTNGGTSSGTSGGPDAPKIEAKENTEGMDPALAMKTPNFLGVPLKGSTVVYVIDRGQGTAETFDGLRGSIMRSLSTLGPETKFQVIFWDTNDELLYPTSGPDRASPENIKQAGKVVADAIAFGASKIEKPLEKALAGKPGEICIATGKIGLDDAWADEVKKIVSGKGVKIHTFALGRSDSAAALKTIAATTGGTFREIDPGTVIRLADFAPSGN